MDDEVKGDGNSVNFTFRMYDPRLGRFFAIDPLVNEYPSLTTYQFCSNSPIYMVEIEGKEGTLYIYKVWLDKKGYHQQYCGSFKVEGLKSDIVKTVLMPFGNPQGAPVQLKYTLRFKNGERGSSVTYSYADKPTVKQLNDFFGDNMPKKEEPKEKTFTQKLNEAAPTWAKHGAMESGDDGANTGGELGGEKGFNNGGKQLLFGTVGLVTAPLTFGAAAGWLGYTSATIGTINNIDDVAGVALPKTFGYQSLTQYLSDSQGTKDNISKVKGILNYSNFMTGSANTLNGLTKQTTLNGVSGGVNTLIEGLQIKGSTKELKR